MEKDENKNLPVKNDSNTALSGALRFFSTDTNFVFILKKTEKLSSALYLITGFFDDQEPLKWKLRNLANSLLSTSLVLKDKETSKKDKTIIELEGILLEIGSQLLVAKHAGLISEMNYNIINKEFSLFADLITSESAGLVKKGGGQIASDYFHIEKPATPQAPEIPSKTYLEKEVQKDIDSERDEFTLPKIEVFEKPIPKPEIQIPSDKGQKIDESFMARGGSYKPTQAVKPLKEFGAVAVKKNSRQSVIISLLRRKKEIMIKDVSPLIEGCSEKTIQRELLNMVKMGLLKKEGEKRWSRYSLA